MTLTLEDQQRIDAIKRFFVLDHTRSENELERIVRFTGQFFCVTYSFLTLRREDGSEKAAAAYGFDMDTLPDDAVFFPRADGPSIPVAVADASIDSRFEKNPLVHGERTARMYASVPLKSAQGFTLGTLAIMDTDAQELNSAGMAMLANIGELVEPVLQLVQARRDQETSASSLAHCQALSGAAVAAHDALSAGANNFSEALGHIGPAASCTRAALFIHTSEADGRLEASCCAAWQASGAEPIAKPGDALNFDSEGLGSWPQAFMEQTPVSEEATGPFLTAGQAQFVAAIPLAVEEAHPSFVLLDRPSPWGEAELTTLQLVFAPLAASIGKPDGKSQTEIIEANPIPIAVVDGLEGNLLLANESARELLGLSADAVAGRTLIAYASEASRDQLASFLAQAPHAKQPPAEVYLQNNAGDERLVRITALPIAYEDRAAAQLAFVDISAERKREATLVAERDQAKQKTRAKSALLASMSHEIRTALTSILGYAEFLADELDADQLDMAQTILGSSERLLQTLNSVIDMERLEAEGDSPPLEPVSIGALILGTARVFEGQAAKRDLAFICEGAEKPIFAWADEGVMIRVLDNLVSNALKFTDQGGIRLRVFSEKDRVCLEVQDTGSGIDEAFLPHLFDKFKRENGDSSRSASGFGLGLALTKRLVDLMGGQITVTSRKGQGSVFRVVLRAAPPPVSAHVGGDGVAVQQTKSTP